jgi:hypothetical protein
MTRQFYTVEHEVHYEGGNRHVKAEYLTAIVDSLRELTIVLSGCMKSGNTGILPV